MITDDSIYRLLQRHLDSQAIGFPSVKSGADIRLLKRLFTPSEAKLALSLSYKPVPHSMILEQIASEYSTEQANGLLESMLQKGAIGWKRKGDVEHWYVMPLLIGMYEAQDGNPSREFLDDADAYMKTLSFGKSFLTVRPSQMRTIPLHKSIPLEHHIATYDQIRRLVQDSPGPFVVLPCICRKSSAMRDKSCLKTSRQDTCLAFGDMASMVLRRRHGQAVTRDEVIAILEQNEQDGLVLQPANARQPEFVCSCCGCCCGMLAYQKFLPRPVDFWASNFYAVVSDDSCSGCGICVDRCQTGAMRLDDSSGRARADRNRCIGCGLCVPTCPSQAVALRMQDVEAVPPPNEEALCDEIKANRKDAVGQWKTLMRTALKLKP